MKARAPSASGTSLEVAHGRRIQEQSRVKLIAGYSVPNLRTSTRECAVRRHCSCVSIRAVVGQGVLLEILTHAETPLGNHFVCNP